MPLFLLGLGSHLSEASFLAKLAVKTHSSLTWVPYGGTVPTAPTALPHLLLPGLQEAGAILPVSRNLTSLHKDIWPVPGTEEQGCEFSSVRVQALPW